MNFGFAILDFGLRRKAVRKTIRSESLSVSKLKSKIQNLKWVRIFAIAFTFALGGAEASAQQTGKVARIGFLDNSSASGNAPLLEAFRQEMRKLGWIEGKNLTFEYRFAEGKFDWLPELSAELVRLKVDLIMVSGGGATGVGGQERHYDYPHCYGERWRPGGLRSGCQSRAAGRQCHRAVEFSARFK
jgi:hypothetical protein